jgi:hypothetical protein
VTAAKAVTLIWVAAAICALQAQWLPSAYWATQSLFDSAGLRMDLSGNNAADDYTVRDVSFAAQCTLALCSLCCGRPYYLSAVGRAASTTRTTQGLGYVATAANTVFTASALYGFTHSRTLSHDERTIDDRDTYEIYRSIETSHYRDNGFSLALSANRRFLKRSGLVMAGEYTILTRKGYDYRETYQSKNDDLTTNTITYWDFRDAHTTAGQVSAGIWRTLNLRRKEYGLIAQGTWHYDNFHADPGYVENIRGTFSDLPVSLPPTIQFAGQYRTGSSIAFSATAGRTDARQVPLEDLFRNRFLKTCFVLERASIAYTYSVWNRTTALVNRWNRGGQYNWGLTERSMHSAYSWQEMQLLCRLYLFKRAFCEVEYNSAKTISRSTFDVIMSASGKAGGQIVIRNRYVLEFGNDLPYIDVSIYGYNESVHPYMHNYWPGLSLFLRIRG